MPSGAAVLLAYTRPGATLPHVDGFRVALLVSAGLGLLTAVLAFVLPGPAGAGSGTGPQGADPDPMEMRMEEEAMLEGSRCHARRANSTSTAGTRS